MLNKKIYREYGSLIWNFAESYLNKIKKLSIILSVFFIASIFLGYILAHDHPIETKKIIFESLKNMLEPAKDLTSFRLLSFIFFKNLFVTLTGLALGIFFGVIPILTVFINGLTLGVVGYIFLKKYNFLILTAGILPHGIIEIPAFILSTASGLWLWRSLYRYIRYDENKIKEEFVSMIKFFILIIIPMLFIAAVIEAFITSRILDLAILLS